MDEPNGDKNALLIIETPEDCHNGYRTKAIVPFRKFPFLQEHNL